MNSGRKGRIELVKRVIPHLLEYVPNGRRTLIVCTLLMIAGAFCAATAPVVGGEFFNRLVDHWSGGGEITSDYIEMMTGYMALLIVAWYVLTAFASRMMLVVGRVATAGLREAIYGKLHRIPISYLDNHPAGELSSRITNDLDAVGRLVTSDFIGFVTQQSMLLMILLIMALSCPPLAIVYVIIIPCVWAVTQHINDASKGDFARKYAAMGDLNGVLSDSVSNHALIKAYGIEERQSAKFADAEDEYSRSYFRSKFNSGLVAPISVMAMNVGQLALALIGAYMIIEGSLPVGTFIMFLFFVRMINGPVTGAASALNRISDELCAFERIYEFLDEDEVDDSGRDGKLDEPVVGDIEFRDVRFSYGGEDVIDGVTFSVEHGRITAIVGPSGSGKTTLVNLLMGFYTPASGSILVDGKDVTRIDRDSIREHIGMVSQVPWVFDGTVAENIGYPKEGCTMDEIIAASRAVGFDQYVSALPDGYDTMIGDDRYQLSVGEKRLLILARAMIADPDILILDEATAGVDVKSEHTVIQEVKRAFAGRTVIIITHNLYEITDAERIVYIDAGTVAESGTHEELLALDGRYAMMYRNLR